MDIWERLHARLKKRHFRPPVLSLGDLCYTSDAFTESNTFTHCWKVGADDLDDNVSTIDDDLGSCQVRTCITGHPYSSTTKFVWFGNTTKWDMFDPFLAHLLHFVALIGWCLDIAWRESIDSDAMRSPFSCQRLHCVCCCRFGLCIVSSRSCCSASTLTVL